MNKTLAIAVGAGLASALLFAASAQGAALALVLALVTPLPIMIAALGFGQATGLVAAGVAVCCIAGLLGIMPGVFVGALLGFPAWWLSYLALLGRPLGPPPAGPVPPSRGLMLWYPIGRIVFWCAGLVAGVILVSGGLVLMRLHGFDATVTLLSRGLESTLGRTASDELAGAATARHLVQLFPVLLSAFAFLMLIANLWLAARIVQSSGLLSRPWPDLPDHLRLPKVAAAVLAVGGVVTVFGGAPRVAGGVVVASVGMAFVLQGLGTAHALTRGLAARHLILFAIYFITFTVVPSAVALAVLGVVDCLFPMRHRQRPTTPPLTKP